METIGNMSPYIEGGMITQYQDSVPLMSADGLVHAQQLHDIQISIWLIFALYVIFEITKLTIQKRRNK